MGREPGLHVLAVDEQFLSTGNEAGTAPDDRRFRPDVEGLRAVAVLLVVFYHASVPRVTGGFVGVDVFFVISGFVITGLLLREHRGTGRTSILNFYARRVRRILPAATLVIAVTVSASYVALGYVTGNTVADDGRWAAVFLSNFHFESVGTNYFTAKLLSPSPLQNFWSLSVEEQFYVVYPTVFLVVARLKGRLSLQARMVGVLVVVIGGSYWLSVVQTAAQPTAAYFSPFTRSWELALGALLAVLTPWLKRIPALSAALLTWVGLAAVAVAAFAFTAQTPYPGSLVAVPVVGTALVIAGGVAAPRWGAEQLLRRGAFQWFGKRSYSLYLWHWPILILAAERVGKTTLPLRENLVLILIAILISTASYSLVENPVRHWKLPSKITVLAGVATILATVAILSLAIALESASDAGSGIAPATSVQAVVHEVAAAKSIVTLPGELDPSLDQAAADWGGNDEATSCSADLAQSTERLCVLGDIHARGLLVVYGDSHALMWLPAFESIATRMHMRLLVLGKSGCPASIISIANPPGAGVQGAPYVPCNDWHRWAVKTINQLAPSVLVVSQDSDYSAPGPQGVTGFSNSQWRSGLTKLFKMIPSPHIEKIFLGNIPLLSQSGPTCLSLHLHDTQDCSTPVVQAYRRFDRTEYSVTQSLHIRYVDPTPWFCSSVCTPIVGPYEVYMDRFHVTAAYATYLKNVLSLALFKPSPLPTHFKAAIGTAVARPASGGTVTGHYTLYAIAALGNAPVTRVEFRLSGHGLHDALVCGGTPSLFGWLCDWNTSLVSNGTYSMQSVAYDPTGRSIRSKPISVSVKNLR